MKTMHMLKKFRNYLKKKNLGEYHDLHVQSDTLLLPDVLPLAWQACLKKTGVELELLTDNNMLMMIEKGIRGGMCHAVYRYAKANNKYMKNYDKDI